MSTSHQPYTKLPIDTDRGWSILCAIICFCLSLLPLSSAQCSEDKIVRVVRQAGAAIVNIKTEELAKANVEERKSSAVKKYFGDEGEDEELIENIGSGVCLDAKGIIVTNEHLISKAINIRVKFISGKEYDAYVLASDPEFDIALLKIISEKVDFPFLIIGNKREVSAGEKAIVIGNPYGLSSSVTSGVVSALGRNLRIENRVYANLIQTDAAINPGNSGGGLLDADGNLLGIVTAIYGEGKGIGFAIPMEDVMSMLSEFLDNDQRRPILGLFMEKKKDIKGFYLNVEKIIPNSPAANYGLKAQDRIIEFNKKKIREGTKIQSILRNIRGGDLVQLRILRDTKKYTINVDSADLGKFTPVPVAEVICGMRVADIKGYPKFKYKLRDKDGVVIMKIFGDGIAAKAGLKGGDVITKINNNPVKNEKDFETFMLEGLKRNYILYQVKRNDSLFFLPLKLDTLL